MPALPRSRPLLLDGATEAFRVPCCGAEAELVESKEVCEYTARRRDAMGQEFHALVRETLHRVRCPHFHCRREFNVNDAAESPIVPSVDLRA